MSLRKTVQETIHELAEKLNRLQGLEQLDELAAPQGLLATLKAHGFKRSSSGVWVNADLAKFNQGELQLTPKGWRCGHITRDHPIDALRDWAGYPERGFSVDYSSPSYQARSLAREIIATVKEYGQWS